MLFALLAAATALGRAPSLESRLSLLEARQMLEAQQVWSLRAELPPDTVKVLDDVALHVQHDQEQDDKVQELTRAVQQLQQRLAALETLLQDRVAEGTRIPVAPLQVAPLEVPAKRATTRRSRKAAAGARRAAGRQASSSARVAEAP